MNSARILSGPQNNVRLLRSGVRPTTVRFVINSPVNKNRGSEFKTLVGLRPLSLFSAVRKNQCVMNGKSLLLSRQKNVRFKELSANRATVVPFSGTAS